MTKNVARDADTIAAAPGDELAARRARDERSAYADELAAIGADDECSAHVARALASVEGSRDHRASVVQRILDAYRLGLQPHGRMSQRVIDDLTKDTPERRALLAEAAAAAAVRVQKRRKGRTPKAPKASPRDALRDRIRAARALREKAVGEFLELQRSRPAAEQCSAAALLFAQYTHGTKRREGDEPSGLALACVEAWLATIRDFDADDVLICEAFCRDIAGRLALAVAPFDPDEPDKMH